MTFGGDWSGLRNLVSGLNDAGDRVLIAATKAAEEEVDVQYAGDFAAQRDPWGNPWAPSPHGLQLTGELAGARATSSKGIVRLKPPKYWVYLHVGAHGMPERGILPFSDSRWNAPIEDKVRDACLDMLERIAP